jgi:hypothetical protein
MELERYLTSDIMSTLLAFFFCLQMALHNWFVIRESVDCGFRY